MILCSEIYSQVQSKKINYASYTIDTSILWPIKPKIYLVSLSIPVIKNGEFIIGPCYQNWDWGDGRTHAYTLILGYRHYIYNKTFLEVEFYPAYNNFHSTIDHKTYSGAELYMEGKIGYRYDFNIDNCNCFLSPSVGFGIGFFNANWPTKNIDPFKGDFLFVPQLIWGVHF